MIPVQESRLTTTGSIPCLHFPIAADAAAKSLQSCPTLCNPMDGGPPGSPVPGILQARIRERGATAFSYQREKVRVLHTEVFGVFFCPSLK